MCGSDGVGKRRVTTGAAGGSERRRRWRAGILLAAALLPVTRDAAADEVGSAVYVRSDSDHTTIVSPHIRWQGNAGEHTQIDAAYTVDVWSSASIDVRTSATKRPRITEQRDELDFSATHVIDELTLGASYRYSRENDYVSHGGTVSASQDLAGRATTLAASLGVTADQVGRAGYPQFSESLTTVNLRLSLTQVLDPDTIASLTYERIQIGGYQASPYRYVGIDGSAGGFCLPTATQCLPERVPSERGRNALAVLAKRAFGASMSAGVSYRFYLDDWGLSSHTLDAQVSLLPSEVWLLSLGYRYYTQGAVDFYRAMYMSTDDLTYLTRDRELSPLSSGRISLELRRDFEFPANQHALRTLLNLARTDYSYDDFPGLDQVTAYEATLSLAGEL